MIREEHLKKVSVRCFCMSGYYAVQGRHNFSLVDGVLKCHWGLK